MIYELNTQYPEINSGYFFANETLYKRPHVINNISYQQKVIHLATIKGYKYYVFHINKKRILIPKIELLNSRIGANKIEVVKKIRVDKGKKRGKYGK